MFQNIVIKFLIPLYLQSSLELLYVSDMLLVMKKMVMDKCAVAMVTDECIVRHMLHLISRSSAFFVTYSVE